MDIGEEKRIVIAEPVEAPAQPASVEAPSTPVVEPAKEPVGV